MIKAKRSFDTFLVVTVAIVVPLVGILIITAITWIGTFIAEKAQMGNFSWWP